MISSRLRKTSPCWVKTSLLLLISSAVISWYGSANSADFVTRGEERFLKGELTEAGAYLEEALRAQPQDPRILSDLGRVYFHQKRYDEAEQKLRLALSLDPEQEWVKCWSSAYLGKIYTISGDSQKAYENFQNAANLRETANCNKESQKYMAYLRDMTFARKELTNKQNISCCILYYGADSIASEDIAAIGKTVDAYYDNISFLFNLPPHSSPIYVYLYPSSFKYDLWEGREVLSQLNRNEIHTFYNGTRDMGPIEHEMVHIVTSSLVKEGNFAPLLMEGMAEYVVGYPWGISLDVWVKGFMQTGDFVPISQLADRRSFRQANPILSYAEAGSFVKFLIGQYGVDSLSRLLDTDILWKSVYGVSLTELEERWLLHLKGLEISDEEMELVRYRLWLGDVYSGGKLHENGLPWAGVAYETGRGRVVLSSVTPDSPAQRAGLKAGDIVKEIEGVAIKSENSWKLASTVQQKRVGDSVSLTVEREGEERSFRILLGSEPKQEKR